MNMRLTNQTLRYIVEHIAENMEYDNVNKTMPQYEKVEDIVKWCEQTPLRWFDVYKVAMVKARPAKDGEQITTTLADGTKETDARTAGRGDMIVSNLKGGGEEWIVKGDVFQSKYEPTETEGVYRPKGLDDLSKVQVKQAAKLPKSLEFAPPNWGGDVQRVNAGGFLLRDPKNPTDIYGIGEKEFADTYRQLPKQTQECYVGEGIGDTVERGLSRLTHKVHNMNRGKDALKAAENRRHSNERNGWDLRLNRMKREYNALESVVLWVQDHDGRAEDVYDNFIKIPTPFDKRKFEKALSVVGIKIDDIWNNKHFFKCYGGGRGMDVGMIDQAKKYGDTLFFSPTNNWSKIADIDGWFADHTGIRAVNPNDIL